MLRKEGKWGLFYSCNNYPYCDYKAKNCPDCSDGFLYHIRKKHPESYSCSNESCNFKSQVCPYCNDGYLVERKKFNKRFWGCSNFAVKKCTYTKRID
jgi:DNA helicase-4